MEATKWLKPSVSGSRIGDRASVQAATRVNAEQASKRTMRLVLDGREHDGRLVCVGIGRMTTLVVDRGEIPDRRMAVVPRRGT